VLTAHGVSVDREGRPHVRVSQDLLGALGRYPGLTHEGAGQVPHVMAAQRRQARLPKCPPQDVPQQYVGVDRTALAGHGMGVARKHKSPRGHRTGELPALDLRNEVGREGHRAQGVLGFRDVVRPPAGGLVLDEQALALEVDRVPYEPSNLSRTQPRRDGELDQEFLPGDIERGAQPADLFGVEENQGMGARRF
jgi:hypothetical protein